MNFKKGYTLLFAVLITSLVISVAVSILNIARKEVILASDARESLIASYVADGALDCAVAYNNASAFVAEPEFGPKNVYCGGANRPVTYSRDSTGKDIYNFYISNLSSQLAPCAQVIVSKNTVGTIIESRGYNVGYNTATKDCTAISPKKVERAFRYSYTNS